MEEPGMSDNTYSFRTALGGFHRGDVSEYIASTAAANKARISDLQEHTMHNLEYKPMPTMWLKRYYVLYAYWLQSLSKRHCYFCQSKCSLA